MIKKLPYLILLGVLIGAASGIGGVFGVIGLGMVSAFLGGLLLLIGLIDLIRKTRYFHYPLGGLAVCAIAIITALTITWNINKSLDGDARLCIEYLESEYQETGQYPDALETGFENINYRRLNNKNYEISYLLADKWHLKTYRSQTNEWIVND